MFVAAASIWCCGKKIRLSTSHTIAPLTKHISVKVAARGRQASNRGVTSGGSRSISLPLFRHDCQRNPLGAAQCTKCAAAAYLFSGEGAYQVVGAGDCHFVKRNDDVSRPEPGACCSGFRCDAADHDATVLA